MGRSPARRGVIWQAVITGSVAIMVLWREHMITRRPRSCAGAGAPLRDRVRTPTAVLSVSATCLFYLQQVDDPDKLRAIVLEIATDLIH